MSDTPISTPRWSELPAPEVRALARAAAAALWPIGSTEQHGPHLVTGFDLLSATAVVDRAAAQLAPDVLVLPGLAFGSSDHWLPLGATISLRPETLSAVVRDVVRSLAEAGVRQLVVVNGHAGNVGPVLTGLASSRESAPNVELVSYWNLVDPAELGARMHTDGGGVGHAGEFETSIGLHLGRGCVLPDRIADATGAALGDDLPGSSCAVFLRAPRPLEESPTGIYGDPRKASADLGELVIEQAADALARHCRSLVEASLVGGQ